jgi:cobalamin biosynthesis protein CobD/CbiB
LSKYRSLMPSLALIFHLVAVADGTASGPVSLAAAQLAAAWCDYLEVHALKLYAPEVSSHIKAARLLAQHIEDGDIEDAKLTVRDLYRRGWEGLDDRHTVISGLEVLAENDWVRIEVKVTGGRPTQVVRLHPELRAGVR